MRVENKDDRIFRYDNLKFLLILLVVVGHFAEPYVSESHTMKSLWIFIYSFHMPVFIFTVGLFSKRVINHPRFRGERIFSYAALFVLYKIVLYITKVLCGSKATFSILTESGIPWFMLSCASFLLLTRLFRRQNPAVVLGGAVLAACMAGYENKIGDFLCLSRTIAFFPFFLIGYYLDVETIENFIKTKRIWVMASLCLLAIFGIFCIVKTEEIYVLRPLFTGRNPFRTLSYPKYGALYRLLHYVWVLCLLPGIIGCIPIYQKFFSVWGTRTLQIYCLHRPILYLYNTKYDLNEYLSSIFPTYWKLIYLSLGVALTIFLALSFFEPPFKRIINWKPALPWKNTGEQLSVKTRMKRVFPPALFLCFTLCVFGPLDLYCANSEELWFGLTPVIIIIGVVFAVLIAAVIAGAMLTNGNTFFNYLTLIFGMALCTYIQGNFLNISYGTGVLDGGSINWAEYEAYAVMNSFIWIICIAAAFLVKKYAKKFVTFFSFASILFVLMQTSALVVSVVRSVNTASASYTITTDGMYTLSEDENIIVFVADTMDEQYFEEMLERHPEYAEKLDGFTHYANTLATGARTVVALPSMLTGVPFKKQTSFSEYVETIWNGDTPLDRLSRQEYDVRVFTDAMYYGAGAEKCINNFSTKLQNVGSYSILGKKLAKLTLYKYAPHLLKKIFWFNTAEFDLAKPENVYSPGDAKFYKNYKKNGFDYTGNYSKAFRFYLLDGAHQPYTLTEKATRDKKGTSRARQVDGCFLILFDMIEDLKENGKFDTSTIIITADHGDKGFAQQPVLLCKLPNASGQMKTSYAPVSLFDLSSTLADLAGEEGRRYGSGINLFQIDDDEERERIYYLNTEKDSRSCIQEYTTTGYAGDIGSMILKNEYYANGGIIKPYQFGDILTFTMDATANQYCTYGFRLSTGWRTPLAGRYSQMVIPLEREPDSDSLHAYFDIKSIDTVSNAIIKSGEQIIFEGKIDDAYIKSGLNLVIPVSSIEDKTLTLNFEFTDIDPEEERLETAKRTMTISFESFVIEDKK